MSKSPEDFLPYTGKFHTQASGHAMHYLDEGPADAPPVVMVHGNPSWCYYYRNVIAALRDHRRCLAPDHIGMGLSDRPPEADYAYTLANRVEDLAHWLDAVVPEGKIDLVVHDWGGAIALAWATAWPERIGRIVLLNTWAFIIPADQRLPWSLKFARSRLGNHLIHRYNAFSEIAARVGTRRRLTPEERAGLTAPYRGDPDRRWATLRFVQDIPLKESDLAWATLAATEQGLARLADKPLQFIWGGKDPVFNDRVLEEWRRIWPLAQVEYLPRAGHYVLEDDPERVVGKIVEFLGRDEA